MNQLTRSERVTLAIVAIAVLAGGIAPTAAPESVGTALMYDAAVLAAATFALAGTLRLPPDRRREWWFVPVSVTLFFGGDVIWDIYEHALHRPAPLPSTADLFYLGAYPLLFFGLLRLVRTRTAADRLNALLDVGTLALAIGLLVWEPLLVGGGRSLAGSVVAGAYPVFDVVLLGFAGILVGARRPSQSTMLLLGGSGVLFIADLTFLILKSSGHYATGGFPDPLFVAGAFLIGASPWFDNAVDIDDPSALRRPRPVAATVVVIAALVALPIDFGLNDSATAGSHEPVVRLFLRIALLAFVAARLLRQALRNERLVGELDGTSTQLQTVIDNTADAVVFTDADLRILQWNPAADRLFGFPREEVLGRSVFDFFVRPENVNAVRGAMAELARAGGVHQFSLTIEPHGEPVAVALQAAGVTDSHGRVIGFVTVARDDTRELLTRHALESLGQLEPAPAMAEFAFELRAFVPFDVLSLASVELGRVRELARVASTGDAWDRNMVAAEPGALVECDHQDFALESIAEGIVETIQLPLSDPLTGETRGLLVLGFATVDAATTAQREAVARIAPEIAQSVANMMLYERERRTAERLQELDDLREGFFALVAHEVRSPLGAIGTAAEVLRDHGASMPAGEAQNLAAGIASGARRQSRLTGDLVDVSRGGVGTFPCEMAPVDDVGAIVAAAAGAAASGRSERVRVSTAPGVTMTADADRLAQVVTNLVTNALKFSEGAVDVCLARDGDDAVLTVSDHGPGIPPAHAHRLFQRFTRLPSNGTGPRPSGTGLGLFITREVVTAHDGSIRHVPTDGGGATFEVRLPCGT
jgi:PAS domain S-box-containing protein